MVRQKMEEPPMTCQKFAISRNSRDQKEDEIVHGPWHIPRSPEDSEASHHATILFPRKTCALSDTLNAIK